MNTVGSLKLRVDTVLLKQNNVYHLEIAIIKKKKIECSSFYYEKTFYKTYTAGSH